MVTLNRHCEEAKGRRSNLKKRLLRALRALAMTGVAFSLFIPICLSTTLYAKDNNLYEMFKDYPRIKVFLKEVIDQTGNPEVEIDIFKRVFGETIENRINITFIYVNDEKDADVVVTAKIKTYTFTEKALPSFTSIWAFTADTTAPKSSAKIVVDYEIISPTDGKTLLSYKNFTTDARKPIEQMKGEMGYSSAVDKNVNRFIYRAFYKPR